MSDSQQVRDKHRAHLFPSVFNYYDEPMVVARAKGTRITDVDGKQYLDFYAGILTVSLGHCHEPVTERIIDQLRLLQHSSTLYQNLPMVSLAEKLAAIAPGDLKRTFFTTSGTEAVDTAVLTAKLHTGNHEIIALRHGYHGRSHLAMSLTAHSQWRLLPAPVSGVTHAVAPYCYRCPYGLTYPSCEVRCARDLEELIITQTTGRPAAFLAEPILGVGGFISPPKEYFEIAVGIVRKHGGLFICDELQTAFGRTGDKMFGIEHYGVQPDIMTLAKGIANGLPIAATVAREEVAASFNGPSIATFGGNPIAATAALATIDEMQKLDTPARSAKLGRRLTEGLLTLQAKYPFIGDVRGKGLMQALELVEDRKTKEPAAKRTHRIAEATRREGLLIGKGGLYGNIIRLGPPMLLEEREVDECLTILDRVFETSGAP